MMMLAERLPVRLIPEESRGTSVRNDMIHNRCRRRLVFLPALRTQWMSSQEPLPCPLPPAAVPTLSSALPIRCMQRCMFAAVRLTVWNQGWTTRMLARCVWSPRHSFLLPMGMKKGPVALGYWTSPVLVSLHYNTGNPPRQFRLSCTFRIKVGIGNGNIGNNYNHLRQLELLALCLIAPEA